MQVEPIKLLCLMKTCPLEFSTEDLNNYARHLASYHGLPINMMELKFKKMVDFDNWRAHEEIRNSCMFVNSTENVLICHRNEYIKNSIDETNLIYKQNEDKRDCKVKSLCPAYIKYEVINDEIYVTYVRTHYGYCTELKNYAISPETTALVKKFAANGKIPRSKIAKEIRNRMIEKNNTDYLITPKHVFDILNKERSD